MAKKLKFGKIRIYFRDGKVDVIPKKLWDDYEYNGCLFVVKRCGAWVYTYNIGDVSCIIVNNKKVKENK
jgi:hypothetical protein